MCASCEIDYENSRNKLPESKYYDNFLDNLLFSYNNPGVMYMKNGDKYEFYQTDDNRWKVDTGLFLSEKFDTFNKMLIYFVGECEKRFCK